MYWIENTLNGKTKWDRYIFIATVSFFYKLAKVRNTSNSY